MDYSKEAFPLNHFALWCKGWYRPTNEKATLEETLKIVFELDGYTFAERMNDFLTIVLTEFDPYCKWLSEYNKKYCTIQMLCQNAINYEKYNEMHGYSVSFAECMFYAIVDFFRYIDNKNIKLKKPIYNRALRTKGLCFRQGFRKDYHGMTYAEQNRIASKMFDK